ncbi:AFG1-like ATPase-domain-containing protein [Ilyonectria robusta]|uniref:AFG1-like ATPase-domain-containing protein n=1 Tax=Ilyonectria robusta TaxID=1079257 RepID=UPI001E8D3D71|nr:AFG1-like ATPase-domain-containing protein [Ilyonectria robusta]KAH8699751.1 AFG1-like ATPase-domain-containing protein [Ilyonectria robusta]
MRVPRNSSLSSTTTCCVMRRFSTAVIITDPLVRYQTHIASGFYSPDPSQHRLARHLHKIYIRVKDYSPQTEYRQRLQQITSLTERKPAEEEDDDGTMLARRNHSIWRNPLFKHLLTTPEGKESVALTRVLTNHEAAIEINSPKGLFLSGEVGTGKSMLLDLLADGLPTGRKRRWHFNTFMLYTLSQLEQHRKSSGETATKTSEYSILWMAKKLVEESPILFLDEFQLPDRAASKILSHLFIAFFQLGGVLIASSNRMPEELQKAIGVDYTPAPSKSLIRRFFGGSLRSRGELYGASSDFANFLEVLKARCDFWQMEGAKDWRRKEEADTSETPTGSAVVHGAVGAGEEVLEEKPERRLQPTNYYLSSDDDGLWRQQINEALSWGGLHPPLWEPSTLVVYGRQVRTPKHCNGFVWWKFEDLVDSFGPADYITMASSYHTFIVDNVPVLTHDKKNEARRFITLLDALYEARCKLIIRAQNPPDSLFFPKKGKASGKSTNSDEPDDATYSETIAEVYQDQMSPFRPNVSYYDTESSTSQYDPDQDSDFKLEKPVDFGKTSAFTGEDERFAYKRAISRLWELCSSQWHARTGDWWQPLPAEARHWEGGLVAKRVDPEVNIRQRDINEVMGESLDIEEIAGLSKWRVEHLKTRGEKGT